MFLRLEALKRGRTFLANLVASLPNWISLGKTFVKAHECLGALPLALSSRFSTGYNVFFIPLGKLLGYNLCQMPQHSLVPRLLRGWSKEPGTHCLRMLSYPRISGTLETSGYYAAISLRLSSYYRSLHAYN